MSENPLGNLNWENDFFLYQNLGVPLPFSDTLRKAFSQGSGIVLGIMFLFPFVPSTFHAMCSNLELEAAISTVFAAFLSLNLSFSMVFAACWCSNCSCNMAGCNWGSSLVLGLG